MTSISHGRLSDGPLSGRADSARLFGAAARHSRRVRFLRVALPVGLVVLVVLILLVSWLQPLRMLAAVPARIGSVFISGTKIQMEAPRLAGFTRDSRPYEFTARTAVQDITRPDVVELKDIRAKMKMVDSGTLDLVARAGLYDSKKDLLTLMDDIRVTSSAYDGRLEEAQVQIRSGSMISEKPVEVRMLQGTVNANRLEITGSGEVLRFSNGVQVVLKSDALRGGEQPKETP